MQIRSGFTLQHQAENEYSLLIPEEHPSYGGSIELNSSGAMLWLELEQGTDEDGLCALLQNTYDVDAATARASVDAFLAVLREADCLADED